MKLARVEIVSCKLCMIYSRVRRREKTRRGTCFAMFRKTKKKGRGEERRGKQRTKEKHSSEEKKLNEKRTKRATMPLFESCFSELRVDGRRLYLKGVNWFGFEV